MLELHRGEALSQVTQQRIAEYKQEVRWETFNHPYLQYSQSVTLKSILGLYCQTHSSVAWCGAGEGQSSPQKHHQSVEGAQSSQRLPEIHQHALQTLPQEVRLLSHVLPLCVCALFNDFTSAGRRWRESRTSRSMRMTLWRKCRSCRRRRRKIIRRRWVNIEDDTRNGNPGRENRFYYMQ